MKTKTVDVSNLFEAAQLPCVSPVIIEETEGMYPHKENPYDNWSYFTAAGFIALRDRNMFPRVVSVVGIGSGVEGIAAERVFHGSLRHLIISDVEEEVALGAGRNVRAHLPSRSSARITACVGSFCEPMVEAGLMADIIHANIPNLPSSDTTDLSRGEERGTFLRSTLYEDYNPPEKYVKWALGAQYAYLKSAQGALSDRGSVLTEVGGRVPLELLYELFDDLGFSCQPVLVGFKEQSEALMDFIGYHEFEKQYGVKFTFYHCEPARATLQEFGSGCVFENVPSEDIQSALERHRVTAGDAIELHGRNVAVGHTVHILRGVKK